MEGEEAVRGGLRGFRAYCIYLPQIVGPDGRTETVTICVNYGNPPVSTFRKDIDTRRGRSGSMANCFMCLLLLI